MLSRVRMRVVVIWSVWADGLWAAHGECPSSSSDPRHGSCRDRQRYTAEQPVICRLCQRAGSRFRGAQSPRTGAETSHPGICFSLCCRLHLLLFLLQPPQFKLDPRLARLLGIHTQTRSAIIQALWQYIKTNKLQDSHDKEYINCDKYFQQVTPFWTQ